MVSYGPITGLFTSKINRYRRKKDRDLIIKIRDVSQSLNMRDIKKDKVVGVHYRKDIDQWESHITVNYVKKFLGYYKNFEEAVNAINSTEKKYGWKNLNVIMRSNYDRNRDNKSYACWRPRRVFNNF